MAVAVAAAIPSVPLEKIEFERIASPSPETTSTPSRVLNAIVLPCVGGGAADRVARRVAVIITPSISLPSGNWPVMSVPIGCPRRVADRRRRAAVDLDAPVVGRDQVLAAAAVPPIVLPEAPSIRMPCWALGSASVPVLSVPIRLPSIRFAGAASVELDPHRVAGDDLRAGGIPLDRDAAGAVDEHALKALPRSSFARSVGADQVADDGDPRGGRARRSTRRPGWPRSRCPARPGCRTTRWPRRPRHCPSAWLPSAVTPIRLYDTMLPVAAAAGDVDAVLCVGRDRVAAPAVLPPIGVVRGADDVDAVPRSRGPVAEHVAASRGHADVVAGDLHLGRALVDLRRRPRCSPR